MKNIDEVEGTKVRALRKSLGLSQVKFWIPLGVSQPSGHRMESERADRIPEMVRLLVFARYVAGLPVDTNPKNASAMVKLGKIQKREAKIKPNE